MSIEIKEYKSANEFLQELRLSNNQWQANRQFETSKWVFRGQANSDWQLIPKAWRPDDACTLAGIRTRLRTTAETNTHGDFADPNSRSKAVEILLQELTEATAVLEFLEFANELGFPTPSNRTRNPKRLVFRTDFGNIESPFDVDVALACHHGISTRLLDFTANPIVAAYFAADSTQVQWPFIAVWALNRELVTAELDLIECPRSEIGFLHAQSGVFFLKRNATEHYGKKGKWPAFESGLEAGSVRKLILPRSEVPELSRLLWLERVSKAHLMPTYDNVFLSLKWKWAWELQMQSKDAASE